MVRRIRQQIVITTLIYYLTAINVRALIPTVGYIKINMATGNVRSVSNALSKEFM